MKTQIWQAPHYRWEPHWNIFHDMADRDMVVILDVQPLQFTQFGNFGLQRKLCLQLQCLMCCTELARANASQRCKSPPYILQDKYFIAYFKPCCLMASKGSTNPGDFHLNPLLESQHQMDIRLRVPRHWAQLSPMWTTTQLIDVGLGLNTGTNGKTSICCWF